MSAKGPPMPKRTYEQKLNFLLCIKSKTSVFKAKNFRQFQAIFPLPTNTYIFLAEKGFAPHPP